MSNRCMCTARRTAALCVGTGPTYFSCFRCYAAVCCLTGLI